MRAATVELKTCESSNAAKAPSVPTAGPASALTASCATDFGFDFIVTNAPMNGMKVGSDDLMPMNRSATT